MTIAEAVVALREGRVTSEELVSRSLEAVERRNPLLNAFITVVPELALKRARKLDQRRRASEFCGPLCGIPVALKDNFRTRGIRTTCGSTIFANYIPDFDSAVTEKLEAAGAVIVGKTGLHEFAYGITSGNPHFGAVRNPWNPDCIPGGSSGGSGAAVASGMVFAAMGSDTGGSIRIPAAFCGCVGLKPTSGRVSRYGVMPLDFSLDHMGPLTRSVRDAAIILDATAGHDPRDDSSSRHPVEDYAPPPDPSLHGVRVGWPENFFFDRLGRGIETAMASVRRAAESLGAEILPVRVPDVAAINIVGRVILMSEASALLEAYASRREEFGEDVRLLFEQGRLLSATDYINAQRLRRKMQREFAGLWREIDCLFTPATAIAAPRIGATTVEIEGAEEDTRMAATRFARSFNVLGYPAISIPCGLTSAHLPVGLQIVAKPFAEARLIAVAAAMETALGLGELLT